MYWLGVDDETNDPWRARLLEAARDTDEIPTGRVLRVKLGYNPNSSSVGSVVTVLFWSATASAAALNLVAALLARRRAEAVADEEPTP